MSSEATTRVVSTLPPVQQRRRGYELAFLPAALEVMETPASPTARITAMAIVGLLGAALVWATIGKVDIIATAQGRVIPAGKSKTIQPFETSVVRAIDVADGQHVAQGQVLIELDSTQNLAERHKAADELIQARLDEARIQALLSGNLASFHPPVQADAASVQTALRQTQAQADEQTAKLANLDHQIAGKVAELQEDQAEVARINATLPMLEEHTRIRAAGLKSGYGNELDLIDARREVTDQQHERIVDQDKVDEAVQAIVGLQQTRAEAMDTYRKELLSNLARAETEAAIETQEEIKAADRARLDTIEAPVAGTVQQLALHTIGGVVTPAQPLLVIVPDGAHLEVEVTLPNRDVGFVHIGQSVEIKVETFDFTRYGLLHGAVTDVSRDALLRTGSETDHRDVDGGTTFYSRNTQPHEPTYIVHVALTQYGIRTERGFTPLEPGMAVAAGIKTGRRTVISYLLSPIARIAHGSGRER